MEKIVAVKFKNGGKVYYFAPGKDKYEKGMNVVVETSKGHEYATVVIPEGEVDEDKIVPPLRPILRVATARDDEQVKRNEARKPSAMATAREKIAQHGLKMKLIDCEFAFDNSKVVFYFSADGRVDFRELVRDLSSVFHMRIELRQVGIRDEIKLVGGIGPCGRECCCGCCMSDIKKVSIKMAKNQGLSLNPTKISGLCGRLMCCLSYENEYYSQACRKVPKVGSEVSTPEGKGKVVGLDMLKMQVKVKIEKQDAVTYRDYAVSDIRFKSNCLLDKSHDGEEDEGDESDKLPEE